MKKHSLLFLVIFSFQIIGFSQSFNHEEKRNKTSLLLGKINKEALSTPPYSNWFIKNYNQYTPDSDIITILKEQLPSYTITAFMGTWCGDSKREIPKLYKVLDEAQFPLDRLTLIAVDRGSENYKQSPGGEHEGLNIHRVPTIIIYKNGKEINRIVESPVQRLEEDILKSIQGDYTPNHHIVTLTHQLLEETGSKKLVKKAKSNLKTLKTFATRTSQLNTYANVLFIAGKTEDAIAVLELNTLLYPEETSVYTSLGGKLVKLNQYQDALAHYEKAQQLQPDNKKIQSMIANVKENIKR